MKRALAMAAMLCLGAATALAKPSTTVFPLTAPNLPMKIASAPEQLSKALADELDGELAKLPLDDAAGLAGCDPEATSCLETVSRNFKSKRIVFGTISMIDEDRLKVTLTRFDPGPDRLQRSFTVEGDVEEMAEELVTLSRSLFDGSTADPDEPIDTPLPKDKPGDPIDPPPAGKGEISSSTILFYVGGGALFAAGVGFLYSSYQIGKDVQNFKPRTEADFKQLIPLENKGAQRQLIGGVLTGIGLVAMTYAIIRTVQERSVPGATESAETNGGLGRRLTPVPIEGGAALVFSMELQ